LNVLSYETGISNMFVMMKMQFSIKYHNS